MARRCRQRANRSARPQRRARICRRDAGPSLLHARRRRTRRLLRSETRSCGAVGAPAQSLNLGEATMRAVLIASLVLGLSAIGCARTTGRDQTRSGSLCSPERLHGPRRACRPSRLRLAQARPSLPPRTQFCMCLSPVSIREMSPSRQRSTIRSLRIRRRRHAACRTSISSIASVVMRGMAVAAWVPALSEGQFIYGSTPANLFLSIYQGRPNGMPAWGELLPESTIWELVAYVQSIAHPPSATFGRTISRTPQSPSVEQTPAEFLQTPIPWSFTTSFSNGQKPVGE